MAKQYVLSIDQSTAGTKALLFDDAGDLIGRVDRPHRQIVNELGWVEHDPAEIWANTLAVVRGVVEQSGVGKENVACVGISNQRETALVWDRASGEHVYNAIVWQCARGAEICADLEKKGAAPTVKEITGMHLSPYFSAAKIAWVLRNVEAASTAAKLCCGTVDSWLVHRLTGGESFKTDVSNAARTQLLDIGSLRWCDEVCALFGIPVSTLPQVVASDAVFGETDFEGYFDRKIPITGAMGDSNGALFGQGCLQPGMIKATYGTGSSIMMNIGADIVRSDRVVTSVGWRIGGEVSYVLEGNINYSGAVMKWIVEDVGLLASAKEASEWAFRANPEDESFLVPAFSGLGAPYWDSEAKAVLCGMSRTTGKAEIVKAAEESIALQIADVVRIMGEESGLSLESLRADGGATKDRFLMQFQCDILGIPLLVSAVEELSGVGAAYAAGLSHGIYTREALLARSSHLEYAPAMAPAARARKLNGWKAAVETTLAAGKIRRGNL